MDNNELLELQKSKKLYEYDSILKELIDQGINENDAKKLADFAFKIKNA